MAEDVWSEQDTTPSAIADAFRKLLHERHAASAAYVPARVLNLVVVVDREWRGGGAHPLGEGGGDHPPRPPPCSVGPGRAQPPAPGPLASEGDTPPPPPAGGGGGG